MKNMKAYERLIRYAQFPTASDENSQTCPSTPSQLELGRALVLEMLSLGLSDAHMDEHGYVYGTIPANIPDWSGTVIGFVAHMDVSDAAPDRDVKCHVIENYDGGEIVLNKGKGIKMSPKEYSHLLNYVGQDLVVTDGTTLLGADNKAGIAEILTMAEMLRDNPDIPHGTVKIAFTPDEEIGRGADLFDVAGFGADFAYTLDGAAFGEVEHETFNAAAAKIDIKGLSIHPGAAKGKLLSAMRVAMEFESMLPPDQKPEYTEGYEGFFHLSEMKGCVESAELKYILRDHDAQKLETKKETVKRIAAYLNDKYGEGTVETEISDTYRNMAEKILPHRHLIDNAFEAVRLAGGEPYSVPVRGGTDGSKLSFMGLPCPNLGTGSHNHHGRFEYAVVGEMEKCTLAALNLVKIYADFKHRP